MRCGAASAAEVDRLSGAPARQTWLWDELYRVRNLRPGFHWGLWGGLLYAGLDTYLLRGQAPWTLHHSTPTTPA